MYVFVMNDARSSAAAAAATEKVDVLYGLDESNFGPAPEIGN